MSARFNIMTVANPVQIGEALDIHEAGLVLLDGMRDHEIEHLALNELPLHDDALVCLDLLNVGNSCRCGPLEFVRVI